MNRTAASLLLPLVTALAWSSSACGPAPVPIDRAQGSASAAGANAATLPPGHPPIEAGQQAGPLGGGGLGLPAGGMGAAAASGDLRFAGVVRLTGAMAASDEGFVFVSVKPAGSRTPIVSRKYAVAEATLTEDGERLLAFELDEAHTMSPSAPGALVLEAWFDPDGYVDTREGMVTATVPIEPGASDAEVVLGS